MTKIIDVISIKISRDYILYGKKINELSQIYGVSRSVIIYHLRKHNSFFKKRVDVDDIIHDEELNNDFYIEQLRKSKQYSDSEKIKVIISYKKQKSEDFYEIED